MLEKHRQNAVQIKKQAGTNQPAFFIVSPPVKKEAAASKTEPFLIRTDLLYNLSSDDR